MNTIQEALALGTFSGYWDKHASNPFNFASHYVDASALGDLGGGEVNIPIASHGFVTGDEIVISGSANYDDTYTCTKVDADNIKITATYAAETPSASTVKVFTQLHITIPKDRPILGLFAGCRARILIDITADSDIDTSDPPAIPSQLWQPVYLPQSLIGPSQENTIYVHLQCYEIAGAHSLWAIHS